MGRHEVGDAATEEFVSGALHACGVRAGARVLEVGCGEGALVCALAKRGLRVVGIDADLDAVMSATRRLESAESAAGVGSGEARCARWPLGWDVREDGVVDAVVFTRSLHHIADLDGALDHAARAVRAGGVLVVEDFAWTDLTPGDAAWLRGVLVGRADVSSDEAMTWWRAEHQHGNEHGLHAWSAMEAALRRVCAEVRVNPAAYLYRYVAQGAAEVKVEEERRVARGAGALVGRRAVGRVK